MSRENRPLRALMAVMCAALFGGSACSTSKTTEVLPETHETRGVVTYNGLPAAGATVTFWKLPLNLRSKDAWRQPRPAAKVEPDGSFVPSCFDWQDGAVEGEYAVTLVWLNPAEPSRDMLNGRFANPAKPPLTVKISPGENALPPIRLTGATVRP